MTGLTIILIVAASMLAVAVVSVLAWFLHGLYLNRLEQRLAARKGIYRDLVAGLAARERALLAPELHQASTYRDFEALEAVLEEQARGVTERPAWLVDAYDRLGLVERYVAKLRQAKRWRERAFAAELLGRVGNAKAVPALLETIQATRSEDADVREIALRALARIADPRAVEPLLAALRQVEVWLAPRIADILVRHGEPVIGPLIGFLEEGTRHPARAWAANILGELRAPRAFPALVRALSDLDEEVRAKSAAALGKLGDRRAVTYLLDHLLSDPAPFVRARIASALGQFNEPEVVDRLVRALGDPAWWVRMRSVEALEQIGPAAEKLLLLALNDPDAEIRIRAAVALERLGVPGRLMAQIEAGSATPETAETLGKLAEAGARELLAEHLAHPSPRVREAILVAIRRASRRDLADDLLVSARRDPEVAIRTGALQTLRELGIKAALPAALDALGDPEESVRVEATRLLGELGDEGLGAQLSPRVSDPEPAVRAAAARALGLLKTPGADADFIRLLRDPIPAVRSAAAEGVGLARWHGGTPDLLELLSDVEPEVRQSAARALGDLREATAVPHLLRAFREPNPGLRDAVTWALARIQPESLPGLVDLMLEDEDVASRLAVVRAGAQIQSPQALRLLESLWADRSPVVRAAAAEVLGRLGNETTGAHLERGLHDPDERVRAAAVDALVRLSREPASGILLQLLREDPSPLVRERAALAVGLFRPPGGEVELLAACQPGPPLAVRAAAALAIGAYDQESIVAQVVAMADEEPLRQFLRHQLKADPEYRLLTRRLRSARHVELRALGASTPDEMAYTLAEGMREVLDPGDRIRLVAGLRAFQGERSRGALLQILRSDPSPEVRAAALGAVGDLLDADELLLTAEHALADPHPSVRRTAVRLLARIAPERALPALLRVLPGTNDPATLQALAAQAERAFEVFLDLALGASLEGQEGVVVARAARYIHHPELKRLLPNLARSQVAAVREALTELWSHRPELIDPGALAALAQDPQADIRRQAAKAWAAGGQFDRLAAMVEDPDPLLRRELTFALASAPDSGALRRLLEDPDERVRAAAFVALVFRGEDVAPPAGLVRAHQLIAEAASQVAPAEQLRRTALEDPDATRRLGPALVLAMLGDEAARRVARTDPVPRVRAEVAQALKRWTQAS